MRISPEGFLRGLPLGRLGLSTALGCFLGLPLGSLGLSAALGCFLGRPLGREGLSTFGLVRGLPLGREGLSIFGFLGRPIGFFRAIFLFSGTLLACKTRFASASFSAFSFDGLPFPLGANHMRLATTTLIVLAFRLGSFFEFFFGLSDIIIPNVPIFANIERKSTIEP